MNVIDNFKKVQFAKLANGDVFRARDTHGGIQLFMKINWVSGCNAVKVSNGDLHHFYAEDTVSPVDCELVVK